VNRESESAGDQAIDRPKIPDGIVRRARRGQRDDDLGAAIAEKKRVAIARLTRDGRATKRAARAADILNVRRTEQRSHPLGPGPADLVPRSAGRVWDHEPDGAGRVAIGPCVARQRSQHSRARSLFKDPSTRKQRHVPPHRPASMATSKTRELATTNL
jgi:hypothetical protein